jgi:lipopolysaccharide transport system ATP-binding protein
MSLLCFNNIGKAFRTYHSEWQRFGRWFGLQLKPAEESWVLRYISFNIQPGEAIGIIGQNGAGKSTLLKIIAGTLQPTEGEIQVNGRISAILELGMGFNPELTGRQNVRHAAGLMGFSSDQIDAAMPDIEAFAEIGEYFDDTVRTYSSGMQMRVAFAVATAWRPEILIVDEALSVGDAYFQHKSFARIREFREHGTTLLIVSHDRSAIQTLCKRAILLEKGSVIKDGDPEEVFDFYNALIAEKENSTIEVKKLDQGKAKTTSGTKEAVIVEVLLQNSQGQGAENIFVGEVFTLTSKVKINKSIDSLVLGYSIKDRLGQVIYGTNTWHTRQTLINLKEGEMHQFVITLPANFGIGSYSVSIALHDRDTHLTQNYDWQDQVLVFNVVNKDKELFQGLIWLPQTTKIDTLSQV